jgi:hypothetical protein
VTFPDSPRPGPPPGGFRPSPPPGGFRPAPTPQTYADSPVPADGRIVEETGHPAVDEVLRSLANAARLAPAEQIAEYEAAHQVLQETLASIDR